MQSNLSITFTYKDLLFRKVYNAITCSILSQFLMMNLCLIIVNGNFADPMSWVHTSFKTVTSFTAWLYVIPHLTIIFAQCLICAKDYVMSSTFRSTRFQKVLSILSLHNLVLVLLHSVVAVVQVWLVLSLAGRNNPKPEETSETSNSVIAEKSFFLLLGGFWTGIYFFAKVYMSDKRLVFPVIHQRKLTQLKLNLPTIFKGSLMKSIRPCIYFTIFYYIWGNDIKQNLFLNFEFNHDISIVVYIYHWLFASLFFFNMNLIRFFFSVFLTEPSEFPLVKLNQNVLTLQESINLQKFPIVQSLACLDLRLLSLWSPVRRQLLFTLSQPGAHPHNWNSLIDAILSLYNSYIEILEKSSENSSEKVIPQVNALAQCQTPVVNKNRHLRNMTSPYASPDGSRLVDVQSPGIKGTTIKTQEVESLVMKMKTKILNFYSIIRIIFGINYFFGEIPQANIQKCLSNGHLIIWSTQGLSELICASLKEDKYGVVQKDLPQIIATLVRLNQAIDKLNKIPALSRRVVGSDCLNYKTKNAISSSLKRSLFHICHTFKDYLREVPMNKEVSNYLHSAIFTY